MITNDDYAQPYYALVKQSKVRKLPTYASSISSNSSSGSSTNNSPSVNKIKSSSRYHHNGDTDEGYASFTTTSTALPSQNSTTLNRDDSMYYTSTSERLPTFTSSSSSKAIVESDSEKSDFTDHDDNVDEYEQKEHVHDEQFKDLVDWPSLNEQVQALVTRLDKWLQRPLPDRAIPVEKPRVDHAYPILQHRISSVPLTMNLGRDEPGLIPYRSNFAVNFVQDDEPIEERKSSTWKIPRPRVHFQLQNDQVNASPFSYPESIPLSDQQQLRHCTSCSRLIQLSSSSTKQRSVIHCPYCEQIYCSKACQKSDWPIHKRSCILSNSYSCCGYILRLMKSNRFLLNRLSTLASSGYLSSGRGAVLLYFDSMNEADSYVQSNKIESSRLMAVYWSLAEKKTNRAIDNLRTIEYEHFKELCLTYDPSTDFVCHVTIRVEADTDDTRYTCVSRTMIHKLSDILSQLASANVQPMTYPTLYFTSVNYTDNPEINHHMRHVFYAKLQVELRERGIEIERHYPELYHKLCDYIAPSDDQEKLYPFTPICLFMRHRYSQQLFMCVINPESEPDRSWLLDRCLVEKPLVTTENS